MNQSDKNPMGKIYETDESAYGHDQMPDNHSSRSIPVTGASETSSSSTSRVTSSDREVSPRSNEKRSESENWVVLGIYKTRANAEQAVDMLRMRGFRSSDISALLPSGDSNKEFAHEKGTKMPEGASAGAASGLVLGGALGWLAGIGAIAIPGIGPFIAAGPIMGMLAGAGVGSAVGGIAGSLIGLGVPEYEAKRYEGQVREGGILLSVHCDNKDWVNMAEDILQKSGAQDISSTHESSADYQESDKPYKSAANL